MLVPINWLKEYVDIEDIEDRVLSDRLTMTGSHVDSIVSLEKKISKVVTGKIIEMSKHPHAEKLLVAKVDIGSEILQIVTGAKNIEVGDYIPVALHGAVLPDKEIIESSELRGIESQGMMCSYEELGVEDKLIPKESKGGILVFPNEVELGRDIKEVLGLNGQVLDIEITFNRPDCLSIIGIARETAATFNRKLHIPEVIIQNPSEDIHDYINEIRIDSPDLCTRYYAKVIKNVKIGPSPLWLQRKIMDAGMRPVNNIVDATNYVMIETGQPLHAFDLEKMKNRKVIIRRANEDENLMTLDKEIRKLSGDMCVIADESDAQCIGGVMGGYDSEITDNTKLIIMECANFNPKSIRMTSKKLGLRSEASSRNEKALSPQNVSYANERVCQLIEQIEAGTIVGGHVDVGVTIFEEKKATLRPYRCTELLGTHIDTEKMLDILNLLDIKSHFDGSKIVSEIPHFRPDIEQEEDLIEEVGRIYGFENIEPKPLKGVLLKGDKSNLRCFEDGIKNYLSQSEFCEIMTYSFISPKKYDLMNFAEDSHLREAVQIINPLGEDFSSMRTTLLPNMLEVISKNINYGSKSAKLYEIGNIFRSNEFPVTTLPDEISTFCAGIYGKGDFYTLKGVLENIFNKYQIKVDFKVLENNPAFHPKRTAAIYVGSVLVGIIGEVHPLTCELFNIKEKVYITEINLEKLISFKSVERKYAAIPKYPSITRDAALVVKDHILVAEILEEIRITSHQLLESVNFFDVYKGSGIEEGHKSIAFSFVFRSKERTLNDEEIGHLFNKIIEHLSEKFDAVLR